MNNLVCYKCHAHQTDIVGVEISGVYDGVCYWQCGKCGHKWLRFGKNDSVSIRLEQQTGLKLPIK